MSSTSNIEDVFMDSYKLEHLHKLKILWVFYVLILKPFHVDSFWLHWKQVATTLTNLVQDQLKYKLYIFFEVKFWFF